MLSETIPLYPLYALLFADTGLSAAQISALFMIWSAVGFVAEVPSGALADRFSRRGALVAAGLLQACGYALWVLLPGFSGFAAGFVLWGLSGALASGAFEALLYDGLAAAGAEREYPRVYGRLDALELLAQIPAAGAATALFPLGGYELVGWVSVGCCLAAAAVAARLPEPPRHGAEPTRYLATIRAGVAEAAGRPAVRIMLVAAAVLGSLDSIEEYFTLLAADWGIPTVAIPLAALGIPLAGAAGAALGGVAGRLGPAGLGLLFGLAVLIFGAAGLLRLPVGLAGVAVFYGLYRMVLVVVDARLQQRIKGTARATVTSVAALGVCVVDLVLFAAWAAGGVMLVTALMVLVALALPRWLSARSPRPGRGCGSGRRSPTRRR